MPGSQSHARRLLYLGFAFPPGLAELHPGVNPAGHALETRMIRELRHHFEIRSAGVLPVDLRQTAALSGADPTSGIAHEVLLVSKAPELFHRLKSLSHLKRCYRAWQNAGWQADAVVVYNLSPIYNAFLRWLKRGSNCPKLILLLLDSSTLGQKLPWLKRFRRRFKPLSFPDSEMVREFDACVGLSRDTEKYFAPRGIPFLWVPGGCTPSRALPPNEPGRNHEPGTPIRFGYFGALGAYAGARELVQVFLERAVPGTLEICGYGGRSAEFSELAKQHPQVKFHGLLSPDASLCFGGTCDLLVNPRPLSHGNENNFASKLFDYALTGRAILTSRLSGVETVLGPEAYYFDPQDFWANLGKRLLELAGTPRSELDRRGHCVQQRVVTEFSWNKQCRHLAKFIDGVCGA
jgi:glycosyltransferase involved in cell wall biosynthesis